MSLWSRLLLEGSPRRDDVRKVIVLVAVAILCSLLVVDLTSAPPTEELAVGDVELVDVGVHVHDHILKFRVNLFGSSPI